ncbi:glutamine--fructose-6-phosphate transaminase (isomerizing) [Methanospirillum lacunae]|uniref:Glutamine--fructose-6-phosphate aminotransferase [isomerizing] n=1 Tax=Methanospirillum lacunae TaxID=668570 RepID=A0A2V2MX26_9EURY|nr:glutamine--fructose-6-phosphate transaminase (isomerizing) [Methanospirillum lacunae]PWR71949.1 glutamine--fructose-6-phosphate transaminase (isomerizing) [Methanospirillum lacunae]
MCGIVGYVGYRQAAPVLLEGLKQLEYRGYDSYGIATRSNGIFIHKKKGKVSDFIPEEATLPGTCGIGHTRWATHGIPSDINAHPHSDCHDQVAIVHNGIIENYSHLKRELQAKGHIFKSETDTEVIPHILEDLNQGNLLKAMQETVHHLEGSYAILAISGDSDRLIAVKNRSPLVLGIGDHEFFAASDITPLLEYTNRVIYLEDGDIAEISEDGYTIYQDSVLVSRAVHEIEWTPDAVQKGGFPHFMLKEIYEQPEVINRAIHSLSSDTLPRFLCDAKSITVVACGSSYHAGLIFRYLAESSCGIPVRVELGSEFKYCSVPLTDVIIGISQSGETADTLSAIHKGNCNNVQTVAVTNVLNSSITRYSDVTILMQAGPEISVAATKSFTAQLGVLLQVVNLLSGRISDETLSHAGVAIEKVLLLNMEDAVTLCARAQHIFYVGRGPFYPVMMEGALKMKEISYIHAESYAAGEIKHGPFSLLSSETPVVAICLPGPSYAVMLGNLKEMKARGTPIVAIGYGDDTELSELADIVIPLDEEQLYLQIVGATVILQMLSYYTASRLGREIDKPRNLAKSVTVE